MIQKHFDFTSHGRFCYLLSSTFSTNQKLTRQMTQKITKIEKAAHVQQNKQILEDFLLLISSRKKNERQHIYDTSNNFLEDFYCYYLSEKKTERHHISREQPAQLQADTTNLTDKKERQITPKIETIICSSTFL